MDLLSRIAGWLGENEATISAVVGITVTARDSTAACKGRALDVIQVSQELGGRRVYGLRQFGLKE